MKSNWNEVKIDDICSIRRGASPRPIQKYISERGIPWVKIADATSSNSRFINETKEFIIEEGKEKSRYIEKGTLILSNSATPGLPKFMNINGCVHDGWLILDGFKGVYDNFLYYNLIENRIKLLSLSNGSVFRNLKTDIVKNFNIKLPPLEEQKSIAKILSDLDEKIEVNNKINKNLEEMAQAIFKQWFVDFEFPNEEGKPYKSSGGEMVESELGMIPKGWKISSLIDIADYLNGLAMQKFKPSEDEKGLKVLKIKELRQGFTDESSDLCSENIKQEYIINNGDVIFSWSGTLLVDLWGADKCGLNQHLFKVTSNKYYKWYYYYWTKFHLNKFISIAKDKATTMGHIKRSNLSESLVFVPNDSTLKLMNKVMNPIITQVINNKVENKRLEKLRDTLLPKLMSGEIRVPLETNEN
ncbi:restriction endonuclease subunit S [Clostridium perfringens]|nr:restriction endonuclease subunit S [Clostridium perfringens]